MTADVIIEDNHNAENSKPIKLKNYVPHRVFSKTDLPAETNNELLLEKKGNQT